LVGPSPRMVKVVAFSLVNELNPRQRPVSWLAVVSRSAFPDKSSGCLDRECRLQLRGQLRHGGQLPRTALTFHLRGRHR